jgi:hypothetical protein
MRTLIEAQSLLRRARGSCQLGRTKKGFRGHGILAQALGGLRDTKLTLQVFRIELRGAFKTKQRVFLAPCLREQVRRFGILLHGFIVLVLFLLQKGVAGNALGRLGSAAAQKPVIYGQSFALVAGLNEHVEQQPIVDARTIRLISARIQVSERLRGFLMLRRFVEHGFVSRDSVLDAILLQESLGAIQMFADVYGHLLR